MAKLRRVELDHGNERLRAWREAVADHPNLEADWRIDVLAHGILELALLHAAEEGLGLAKARLGRLFLALLLLCDQSLVLGDGSVEQGDEALSHLEEVLVRLVRSKLDLKVHARVGLDLGAVRPDFEWILNPLTSGSVHNLKEAPVNFNREHVVVVQGQLAAVANSARLSESKINEVGTGSDG